MVWPKSVWPKSVSTSRCLLRLTVLPQPERKTQPKFGWQQKPTRKLEKKFIDEVVWQDWTTPVLSRRLESHGRALSFSVFFCAGVCIYHFPFPCAPAYVAANLICLAPSRSVCHGGRDRIGPDRIWPFFLLGGVVGCSLWGCCGGAGWVLGGSGGGRVGRWAEGWGPKPRTSGAIKGGGPQRGGGPKGGGPKFRAFFFSLPSEISLFLLSGGLLVKFWWCLKRRGAQMCTFGVL